MLREILSSKEVGLLENPLSDAEIHSFQIKLGEMLGVQNFKFPSECIELFKISNGVYFNTYVVFEIPNEDEYQDDQIGIIFNSSDMFQYIQLVYQTDFYCHNTPKFSDFSDLFCFGGSDMRGCLLMGHSQQYLGQIFYLNPPDAEGYPLFIKLADSLSEFIETLKENE